MWDAIYTVINVCAGVFSIIAASFSFFIWIKVRQHNKKLMQLMSYSPTIENFEKLVEYHSQINTINPRGLALSVLQDNRSVSIKKQVEEYLKMTYGKNIQVDEILMDGLSQDKIQDFLNKLREKRRIYEADYVTELHVFIAGPIIAGVLLGASFDNWIPVKLYHMNHETKKYEYWTPLIK